MKVSVDHDALAKAAKAVSKFLPRNAVMMAQNSILVEAEGDHLALTATDIESGRRIEVEATIHEEGRILAPSDLASVIAGSGGSTVELAADTTHLSVSDASASWSLRLGSVDDYPTFPRPKLEGSVPIEDWSRIRAIASFAEPRSGKRPVCQGVMFEDGHVVATDTYQCAISPLGSIGEHPLALVPANAVTALDADVSELRIGSRSVEAVLPDGRWWTRLIDGQFPKVKKLIEDQPAAETVIEIDSADLTEVVRRATLVGNHEFPVRLQVEPHGVTFTRREQGAVIFSETIPVEVVDGGVNDNSRVDIRPEYLRSLMAPVSKVRLGLLGPDKLIRFNGAGDGEEWYGGAVMPVRTGTT